MNAREYRRKKYTVERFLQDCAPSTAEFIRQMAREQEQFEVDKLPSDALPPVMILTEYAKNHDIELVDDYDKLLLRTLELIEDWRARHPDLFFVSAILINYENYRSTTEEGFESINVPEIWSQLYEQD